MARLSTAACSLLALTGALALAACNSQNNDANQAGAANDAAIANDMIAANAQAAVAPEDLPLPAGDAAVVEDASTAPAIQVVEVPAPAPSLPADEAAPLTDAASTERLIDAGTGITRVQQADGWAWMQGGQIIRTASADGHRVSYFRRGSTTPYFVQQDGRGYGYSNGRISHEYDGRGRPQTPDAQHQREAQQLADQARQQHQRAQQASRTAPHIDRGRNDHQPADRNPPRPSPSPSQDHGSGSAHGQPGDQRGDNHSGANGERNWPDHNGNGNAAGAQGRGDSHPTPPTDRTDRYGNHGDSQSNQTAPRH